MPAFFCMPGHHHLAHGRGVLQADVFCPFSYAQQRPYFTILARLLAGSMGIIGVGCLSALFGHARAMRARYWEWAGGKGPPHESDVGNVA